MREQARLQEQGTLIVFQQELRVQLVNVSRSGCLLQVSRPVRVGTVGRLRVAIDDTEYADNVRVARCETADGASCELGVELLWVPKTKESPSGGASLALRLRASGDGAVVAEPQPKET